MADSRLLDSRYQFVKTLGYDPQGSTYLVVDTFLEDQPKCVVKKLPLPGKSSKAMRFILVLLKKKAEALKHAGAHDQIPRILAHFEEDNFFYLVEEFIPGRPLSDVLKPRQSLPEMVVQQLIREILNILLIVHSWGVIHRCIKPSNLIQRSPDNKLVLTGFGIFKEISAQNNWARKNSYKNGIRKELSVYVPLDQSVGQRHFSSDIYAVGMIGIQALTGLPPRELQQLKRIGQANEGYIPESLSWHSYATVSPEFQKILDRMICPNPERRYTTAANVLEDLDKVQSPSTTTSRPMKSTMPQAQPMPSTHNVAPSTNRSFRPRRWHIAILALAAVLFGVILNRVPQRVWSLNAVRQGEAGQQRADYDAAIGHYTQALSAYPSAKVYTKRGIVYFLTDEPLLAQEDLNRAIELDNTIAETFYYRGNVRYRLGNLQGALGDYTQAIQLAPNDILKAYVNRGSIREKLGDHNSAIADYDYAIQRDPNLAAAYLNRCLSRSNIEEHQAALADCSQAIRLEPSSVLAYQNRGLVRRRLGETAGAIQDFNIAINLDPEDPDPYYNRGLARSDVGDTVGAIADYTKAIALDPNHTFAYYDRAIAKMEGNDIEGAILDLEQSAKLCLDSARMDCYNDAQYKMIEARQLLAGQASIPFNDQVFEELGEGSLPAN